MARRKAEEFAVTLTADYLERAFAAERLPDSVLRAQPGSALTTASGAPPSSVMAMYVLRHTGGRMVGYHASENPDTRAAAGENGHDFALVGGQYIVDLWARDAAGVVSRAVFDLDHKRDSHTIWWLYGDRSKWRRNEEEVRPERGQVYGLYSKALGRKFCYHADSLGGAISKAIGWCHYHSFTLDDFDVSPLGDRPPFDMHDEWVGGK
jgi:hypothetical protein